MTEHVVECMEFVGGPFDGRTFAVWPVPLSETFWLRETVNTVDGGVIYWLGEYRHVKHLRYNECMLYEPLCYTSW